MNQRETLLESQDDEGDFAILAITPGIMPFSFAWDFSIIPSKQALHIQILRSLNRLLYLSWNTFAPN